MAMTVRYVTFDGVMLLESRGGVQTTYIPDTLGSLMQCRDTSGNKTYSTEYWPYGEVRTSTGTNPSPWGFVGLLGYLTETLTRLYVRARHYRNDLTRWMTVDPLWPPEKAYSYVSNKPIAAMDPEGTFYWSCNRQAQPNFCDRVWNAIPYHDDPRLQAMLDCISNTSARCNFPNRYGPDPSSALQQVIDQMDGKPGFRVVYDGNSGLCGENSSREGWSDLRSIPPTVHICRRGVEGTSATKFTCLVMHELLHAIGMGHTSINNEAWDCMNNALGCSGTSNETLKP